MTAAHDRANSATPRRGFTLVELLSSVAVIAVLAALLLPALWTARAAARRSVCGSNLRQVGLAAALYRQDFEQFPPRLSDLVPAYLTEPRVLICPNDSARGHHAGTDRLEGDQYLPTGVSVDYVPRWKTAIELGWWRPGPEYGPGRWEDLTPLADCQWHWATSFHATWSGDDPGARGWQLVLTAGGSVRRLRVEEPVEEFSPERYR